MQIGRSRALDVSIRKTATEMRSRSETSDGPVCNSRGTGQQRGGFDIRAEDQGHSIKLA